MAGAARWGWGDTSLLSSRRFRMTSLPRGCPMLSWRGSGSKEDQHCIRAKCPGWGGWRHASVTKKLFPRSRSVTRERSTMVKAPTPGRTRFLSTCTRAARHTVNPTTERPHYLPRRADPESFEIREQPRGREASRARGAEPRWRARWRTGHRYARSPARAGRAPPRVGWSGPCAPS